MAIKKGIILAGGTGSRLYPLNHATNKQLLPIYDKPVIYYPLTSLMLAGINEILIISTERDLQAIKNLLGDGTRFGISLEYAVQARPSGLPEAFLIGEKFINEKPVTLILGDNFFHGQGLSTLLIQNHQNFTAGANIYTYQVDDPSRYGVAEIKDSKIVSVVEKPVNSTSNFAITGLYSFDGTVVARSKSLKPSKRNETEIVDLITSYMHDSLLNNVHLGRGFVWFDVGTPESLSSASNYVEVIQSRQGISIASPEEVAWRMNNISLEKYLSIIHEMPNGQYKQMLTKTASMI